LCINAKLTYVNPYNLTFEKFAYSEEEKFTFVKAGLDVSTNNYLCGPIDHNVLRYDSAQDKYISYHEDIDPGSGLSGSNNR
jgi:hypothetical protein